MTKKDPDLMFRYARGLGDAVACFLHSRYIGWLTHFITGTDKPCQMCSIRRHALNVIFPIPFWRLFFKDEKEAFGDMVKNHKENNQEIEFDEKTNSIVKYNVLEEEKKHFNFFDSNKENYLLVNDSETERDNILIKVQVFRKKI